MHGQTILNHNLLRHIIDDIKPVVGTRLVSFSFSWTSGGQYTREQIKVELTRIMPSASNFSFQVITNKLRGRVGSRTAKRRRIAEDTNLMNGNQVEQIINPTANEFLTSAALKGQFMQ